MRALALFSAAVLALLAVTVVAQEPHSRHPHSWPPHSRGPRPHGGGGNGISNLVRQLTVAVMRRDFRGIDRIIDENATIYDSSYSCAGPIDKTTFVQLINQSGIASEIINILDHTESANIGVFHYQDAFLTSNDSQWSNATVNQRHDVFAASPAADGQSLLYLRKVTDGTARQANASAMMTTFWAYANASVAADVAAMAEILSADAVEAVYLPRATQPTVANSTVILANLKVAKATRAWLDVAYDFAFPSCGSVVALVTTFDAQKDGRRVVNKAFVELQLDADMKVRAVESFPLFE